MAKRDAAGIVKSLKELASAEMSDSLDSLRASNAPKTILVPVKGRMRGNRKKRNLGTGSTPKSTGKSRKRKLPLPDDMERDESEEDPALALMKYAESELSPIDKFQAYLDSVARKYDGLNLGVTGVNGRLVDAGEFEVDMSILPEIMANRAETKHEACESEDYSESESDSNNGYDEDDSNDEDNWRNDYPDEVDYQNGDYDYEDEA